LASGLWLWDNTNRLIMFAGCPAWRHTGNNSHIGPVEAGPVGQASDGRLKG
jgi:hypothetical protein